MTVIKICGVCIISAFAVISMKEAKIGTAPFVAVSAVVAVSLAMLPSLANVLKIAENLSIDGKTAEAVTDMVKAIGIAYISCTAAEICRESGSQTLAVKVETAAKIEIIVLSLPYVTAIIESAIKAVG